MTAEVVAAPAAGEAGAAGVVVVTLRHTGRLNAMSRAMWRQLRDAAHAVLLPVQRGAREADGVHVVEFDLGRHFLFINENFETDGGRVGAQGGPIAEADGVLGHGVDFLSDT